MRFLNLLICVFLSAFMALSFTPYVGNSSQTGDANDALEELQTRVQADQARLEAKYNVERGERPPIDLNRIPDDSYEQGVISIKLKPYMDQYFNERSIPTGKSGYVETGIASFDEINRSIGAVQYTRKIDVLYDNSPASLQYKERHRAWGLNLWHEIRFDSKVDVIEAVKQFSSLDEVEIAEPLYKTRKIEPVDMQNINEDKGTSTRWTPNDPYYADHQWHFNNTGQDGGRVGFDVNAETAWDIEKGNSDVIVAVIDGGVQYNHPDLEGNMWGPIGPQGTNTEPDDHGSHVAGTVSGVTNNGVGLAGLAGGSGSNDGVRIMTIDLWGNHGLSNMEIFAYAADNGASISQNSWGYTSAGVYQQEVLDAIDYFNANGGGNELIGGITIFAAGNDNHSGDWYPAYYEGAMAVASHDRHGEKSSFSNYGSWIDITAPGTDIASMNGSSNYVYMSGTSMACPHVSGAAALVVSYAPGQLTNDQLWDILINSANDELYQYNSSYNGLLGSGALDAYEALILTDDYIGGTTNYNLSISIEGPGTTQPEPGTYSYEEGTSVTISANPLSGASFDRWEINGSNYTSSQLTLTINQNVTAVAYFSEDQGGDCPVYELPFTETFDGTTAPDCWEVTDNQGNGQVWQFGTFSGGLSGTSGNYAYLDSDGYGRNNTQNSDLVTPTIDMSEYSSVNLSFKHYFRQYQSVSTATLSYSVDNGQTWYTVQQWTSNTSNPATFDMDIDEVAGHSEVKFKWNYTGTWGYYWSIDDVEITGETAATEYQLTIGSSGQGTIDPQEGTYTYPENTGVQISATPHQGWEFSHWTVNGSDYYDAQLNITMNQDITATAYFVEEPGGDCPVYGLPFTETFDGTTAPDCWEVTDNQGNGQVWQFGTFSGGLSGTSGNYAYLDSDGYGSNNSQNSDLITPTIDMSEYSSVNLSFKHYFRQYQSVSTATLSYSVDNGQTWHTVQQWTSNTSNPATFDMNIDQVAGHSQVKFKWNYTGTWGYYWSIDDVYITGVDDGGGDDGPPFGLPYVETFDDTTAPDYWEVTDNQGNGQVWKFGTFNGGVSGTEGNYAYLDSDGYGSNNSQNSDLITPTFDLSEYSNMYLSFEHYFRQWNDVSTATFAYSVDNGQSWTNIRQWTSTIDNPTTYNLDISALSGQSQVKFKFNYTGTWGYYWSIDDFTITTTQSSQFMTHQGIEQIDELEFLVDVYPNPASDRFYIESTEKIKQLRLIDLNGQVIIDITVEDYQTDINANNLQTGVYFIQILTEDDVLNKRVQVVR